MSLTAWAAVYAAKGIILSSVTACSKWIIQSSITAWLAIQPFIKILGPLVVVFADRRECLCSSTLCSTISRDRTCREHCSPSNSLATLSLPAMSSSSCSELSHLPLPSNSSATSTSTLRWTKTNVRDNKVFGCVKLVAEVKSWHVTDSKHMIVSHIVNRYALCCAFSV